MTPPDAPRPGAFTGDAPPPGDAQTPPRPFTGRLRRRKTRRSVLVTDVVAATVIRLGGLSVVLSFATIVVFLVVIAAPLLAPAGIERAWSVLLATDADTTDGTSAGVVPGGRPVAVEVDENVKIAWVLDSTGVLSVHDARDGSRIKTLDLAGGRPVTAVSHNAGNVAVGLRDGFALFGTVGFDIRWVASPPPELIDLQPGETRRFGDGIAELTPIGQIRVTTVATDFADPADVGLGEPTAVRAIDYFAGERLEAVVALRDDGRLFYNRVAKQRNMMTGQVTTRLTKFELPRSEVKPADKLPIALLMGQNGRMVYVVYEDGHVTRYVTADPARSYVAEEAELLDDRSRTLTSVRLLNGGITLVVGDSGGGVAGWFASPLARDVQAALRAALSAGLASPDVPGDVKTLVRDNPRPPFTPQVRAARDRVRAAGAATLPADVRRRLPGSMPPPDYHRMARPHVLADHGDEVVASGISIRDRQFVTGDARGNVWVHHMTSATTQARAATESPRPVQAVTLSPRADAVVALDTAGLMTVWDLDNPHPDGSLRELFLPVHYEGYSGPQHVWQSSAGTDDAEPKHGLFPLVFGTFKATIYAMLFAVPVAILGAIYSSEFMAPGVRQVVKPTVELMAGLPSVVLGFLAALVLAPFVEGVVPAVLLVFVAVPAGVMLFGFVWQVLPPDRTNALPRWLPFGLMLLLVVLSGLASYYVLGPAVERLLLTFFNGDFRAWLDGRAGTGPLGAVPGWLVLFLPLVTVLLVTGFNLFVRPKSDFFSGRGAGRVRIAAIDLLRFVVTGVVALGVALVLAVVMSLLGLDVRAGLFGPYAQRNAFVVGVVMGFAIIPIIYTVSEDALNSVPNTLRSAALGAGATPWQTAVRVVLPVAASGIFSACMIGLGRAAGETMIVLMAAGNTPLIELNLFSGLRTLSANIAVELPEAPVGGTHYRILFFSALVLFAVTFVVNTAAEIVRLRFRRRAFQL